MNSPILPDATNSQNLGGDRKVNISYVSMIVVCGLLAGCQTGAQQEMGRQATIMTTGFDRANACAAAVEVTPAFQLLKRYFPLKEAPSLQMQANRSKATPEEARAIFEAHSSVAPCRKIRIETANAVDPLLAAPFAELYARTDAVYLGVAEKKITWGEFAQGYWAASAEFQKQYSAAAAQIKQGLSQSHDAEVARRQRAAAAFSQWAQQQELLMQQQQVINAMNQPRMTNCSYIGTQLNCTTF